MAVRSIIDIEVRDEAFQRFLTLFEEYSKNLHAMPDQWQKLEEAMGGAGDALKGGAISGKEALALAAAQAGVIAESLHGAVKAQNELEHATVGGNKALTTMTKTAQGLGKTLLGVGKSILTLGVAGLGLGALFSGLGIGELTDAAFTRFRSAGQLGLSPGALASFQVNAQQFLGTSALQSAANTQIDISKAGYLSALGIGYPQAQQMTASDLAFEELKKARAAYLRNPSQAMQNPAIMSYLALGGNIGDVRNAAMPGGLAALNAAQAATRADVGALGFSRATGQAWTKLKITLDEAGLTIQSALIDKLGPLTPQIGQLAKDVAAFITTFLNSKDFGIVVKDVKTGLKGMIQFLETTDWKAVGSEIGLVGAEIGAVALKLKWLLPDTSKNTGNWHGITYPKDWMTSTPGGRAISALEKLWNTATGGGHALQGLIPGDPSAAQKAILASAKKYGVDPILALADARYESGLNPRAIGDKGTSFGLFQLHQGGELGKLTMAQAFDPTTNANRALAVFAQVAKRHPDWSPGQIALGAQRADPNHGKYVAGVNAIYDRIAHDWAHHLPSDARSKPQVATHPTTTDPLWSNRVIRALKTRTLKPTHISITNSTAARVAVSVNAAS